MIKTNLIGNLKDKIKSKIKKGVQIDKFVYIPNTVESYYKPVEILDKYKSQFPEGFNILFAGNIGFAQDFNTIVNAAKILNEKKNKGDEFFFKTGFFDLKKNKFLWVYD